MRKHFALFAETFCSIYGIAGGRGLVENVIGGRGLKLLKKPPYDI